MRTIVLCFGAAVLVAGSILSANAELSTTLAPTHVTLPSAVVPLDTFSFDIVGSGTGGAAYLVSPQDVTFGTTTTLSGVGLGGSNVTITSRETIGATTTDTFTVSTPTNFVPSGYTIGGKSIRGLEFDIDEDATYNDPVNVLTPITSYTASGNSVYSGGNFALSPTTTLLNSGSAYQMYEGVSVGTGSISTSDFTSFTYSITYPTVPEPATVFGGLACFLLLGMHLHRRTKRQAAQD